MKIVSIGGGPAGLYLALLMKRADPGHDVLVVERNRPDDTFGFGVVFSDATLDNFAEADPESHAEIIRAFAHWDAIHVHYRGQVVSSTGHGFSGLSRRVLLDILQRRCAQVGVKCEFQTEVTDLDAYADADLILAADGANSTIRARYADHFQPDIDWRPNRFVWLGTTFPFPAFTFIFKEDDHGLWRVHAYRYEGETSTFILETTEATWRRAGLVDASEDDTVAFVERLFAEELDGHPILKNRSLWRSFPTIRNRHWAHGNVVLVGDAAHTAHFSVGSGTKLAMEDAIALGQALRTHRDVPTALAAYETERRPQVESLQRAAQVSLEWFEDTDRYYSGPRGPLEPLQFAFSLLTRSLRITHEGLRLRDPGLLRRVDRWVADRASEQVGATSRRVAADPDAEPARGRARAPARRDPAGTGIASRAPSRGRVASPAPPPMFTPFRLRDLVLANRIVVSPMCQYSADDGTPNDWHLVNLGSRAVGGAALVIAEMTDVTRDGRISPGCTGLYKPEHESAWRRVVEFVHRHSAAKIGIQLAHAGRKGSTRRLWEGVDEPLAEGNWPLVSASPVPYLPHSQVPREMTRHDMDEIRNAFVASARMAETAGFDLLELHMAHGYLLASFVSPLTNVRTDEYGGSPGRRMRYPLEVFDAVRAVWPAAKPISVKISATDWAPGGLEGGDAVEVATLLRDHGCDAVTVSTGQTVAHQEPVYGRLYQAPFSDRIRHEASVSTMTVGNLSSWADANSIVAAGRADLCVLARGHLYDPYWTRHAARDQGYDLPWPDQYASVATFTPRAR